MRLVAAFLLGYAVGCFVQTRYGEPKDPPVRADLDVAVDIRDFSELTSDTAWLNRLAENVRGSLR